MSTSTILRGTYQGTEWERAVHSRPEGLVAEPLSKGARVKRNQVLASYNSEDDVWRLYRVAKASEGGYSVQHWFLVDIEFQPLPGKDGSARSHYPHYANYFQTDASRGWRIYYLVDKDASQGFLNRYIAMAASKRQQLAAEREAYRVDPAGGVSERLTSAAQDLQYRAAGLRKEAAAMEELAEALLGEVEILQKK